MKSFKSGFLSAILVVLLLLVMSFLFMAQGPNGTIWNYQIRGFLYGKDAQFAGERAWGTTGTADTLIVTGVDTSCVVFLTSKSDSVYFYYDVGSSDTIFVTSNQSLTATTDKYSYLVIKNGYNASD